MPKPKMSHKAAESALAKFQEGFEKSFGEGTLRRAKVVPYEVISTGSVALDIGLGVGGYVEGRLHEMWGPDNIGKTTLALLGCAEAQRKYPDRHVAYIDVENKLDEQWAMDHGVDLSRLYIYVPKTAEDTADALKRFLNSPLFCMAVVDSIGAMISKAEQEKDAEDDVVAVVARIVTRMVKIASVHAEENGDVVLFINQIRSLIKTGFGGGFGPTTTLPGGWALKYGTTIKLKLRFTDKPPLQDDVKGEKIEVAREIAVQIERNKCAPKGQTVPIMLASSASKYGPIGVDKADEAANIAVKLGVIPRAGAWYVIPTTGERVNGLAKVVDYLRDHHEDLDDIRQRCINLRAEDVVTNIEPDGGDVEVTHEPTPPTNGKRKFAKPEVVEV